MSSPHKFRVWSNGLAQWITHCVVLAPDGVVLTHSAAVHDDGKIEHRVNLAEPLKPVMERFTGVQDKNGRDIYENDIVQGRWIESVIGGGHMPSREKNEVYLVEWKRDGFEIAFGWPKTPSVHCSEYQTEVIGNVHENPELLPSK